MRGIARNQSGGTMIQVLVASVIGSIIMMSITEVLHSGNKEAKALREKLAVMDLEQSLIRTLADGSVCSTLINQPTPQNLTFNPAAATGSSSHPLNFNLSNTFLPVSSAPGASAVVRAGEAASPLSSNLVINPMPAQPGRRPAFQLINVQGAGGTYSANFQVNFDLSKLERSLRAASTKVILQTTTVGALQKITGCRSNGSSAEEICEKWGGRFVTGATMAQNRCILPQQIITNDNTQMSSGAMFELNNAIPIPPHGLIGHIALGYPQGEFSADGGDDSRVVFANTGADGSEGGMEFRYSPGGANGAPGPNGLAIPTMTIKNDGRVGIGFPGPTLPTNSGSKLFVLGDVRVNGDIYGSGGMLQASDSRLKKNIQPILDPISKLGQIRGVTFDWKRIRAKNVPRRQGSDMGVIAQDVEKVFPDMVTVDSTGYKWVNYQRFIPVLIEALKDQNTEIERLHTEVNEIKAMLCAKDPGLCR